jgi:cytochrome b6
VEAELNLSLGLNYKSKHFAIAMNTSLILRRLSTIFAVITLTLTLLAAVTGVLLAFYYTPTAGGAYNSLDAIATEIPSGTLIRSLHNIGGNGLIGVALIELIVLFLGRRSQPSWFTAWVSGIVLILTGIGLGWTAMILDWSQVGYWRFQIELGAIESIPRIGGWLRDVLTGGGAVNTTTVQHLYTLHSYILAIAAVVLAIVHLISLLYASKKPLPEASSNSDSLENLGIVGNE